MGILDDLQFIADNYVSADVFFRYIADVKRKLITGKGIFDSPDLDDFQDIADDKHVVLLENYIIFPNFHRIWGERYTRMLKQINLSGQFRLVAQGVPLIDPTALAKALGSKEKQEVKIPDIFFEIQGQSTPDKPGEPPPIITDVMQEMMTATPTTKTIKYFTKYMSDVDPMDPNVMKKFLSVLTAPEALPKPKFPRPQLSQYGYEQRRNFEKNLYKSQLVTHTTLMATAPALFPAAIAELSSGAGCNTLLKTIYQTAKSTQPESMETSRLEIAAKEILLQHQVKLQCAILFGLNLGSGAILDALVTTPKNSGGVGLTDPSQTYETVVAASNDAAKQIKENSNVDASGDNSNGDIVPNDKVTSTEITVTSTQQNTNDNSPPEIAPTQKAQEQTAAELANQTPAQGAGAEVSPQEETPPKTEENKSDYISQAPAAPSTQTPTGYGKSPEELEYETLDEQKFGAPSGTFKGAGNKVLEEDTTPPEVGPVADWRTVPIPEPAEAADSSNSDNEDEVSSPMSAARRRVRDIVLGGPTVPPNDKFKGGMFGGTFDESKLDMTMGVHPGQPPFKGVSGAHVDPEWGQEIPGCRGVVGGGYLNTDDLSKLAAGANADNSQQAIYTSCGQVAGWLLSNVIFDKDHDPVTANLVIPTGPDQDKLAASRGQYFQHGIFGGKPAYIGGPGFTMPYAASTFEESIWVNCSIKFAGADPDTVKKIKPRAGDYVLIIDDDKATRHACIAWNWNPQGDDGGFFITIDGGISNTNTLYKSKDGDVDATVEAVKGGGMEGMSAIKRPLRWDPTRGWMVTKYAGSGANLHRSNVHIQGFVPLDALLRAIAKIYGDKYPKPPWFP